MGVLVGAFLVMFGVAWIAMAGFVGSWLVVAAPVFIVTGALSMIGHARAGLRQAEAERRANAERDRILVRLKQIGRQDA